MTSPRIPVDEAARSTAAQSTAQADQVALKAIVDEKIGALVGTVLPIVAESVREAAEAGRNTARLDLNFDVGGPLANVADRAEPELRRKLTDAGYQAQDVRIARDRNLVQVWGSIKW